MQGKKAFFGILVCANVLVCVILLGIKGVNLAVLASFEFAFFSSLFIIILSFLSYQKNINNKVHRAQTETAEFHAQTPQIFLKKKSPIKILKFKAANDDFKPTFRLALKNFGVFFSLAKLGAYALLALGFLLLQRQDLLDIAAFLGGISSVLLGVFVFMAKIALKLKNIGEMK